MISIQRLDRPTVADPMSTTRRIRVAPTTGLAGLMVGLALALAVVCGPSDPGTAAGLTAPAPLPAPITIDQFSGSLGLGR